MRNNKHLRFLVGQLKKLSFRRTAALYIGCGFNWGYAVFKMFMSLLFASPWHGAIAFYYVVLGMMRFVLIRNKHEADQLTDEAQRALYEYYGYRQCGYMMFALNACDTGIVVQVIRHNQSFNYPRFIIGVYAVYALVMLNIAFRNFVIYRNYHSPNFSAAKIITFSMALMSIISLQTAMFAQFGGGSFEHGQTLNISLSCIICLTLFGMAIFMIVKASKEIDRLTNITAAQAASDELQKTQMQKN